MDQMKMAVVSTLPVKIVISDNQLADNGGDNDLLTVLYSPVIKLYSYVVSTQFINENGLSYIVIVYTKGLR